jgi:hypothetical protein
MEKLTPTERVSYAHGRIARDMQDFQRQIDNMHKVVLRERNAWIIAVIISTALITAAFYYSFPNTAIEFILIGLIVVGFVVIRFISFRSITRQIAMLEGMQFLYSRLANDTTIGFVTETMQAEEVAEVIGQVKDVKTGDGEKLRAGLLLAGNLISAMLVQADKDNRGSIRKANQDQDA